MYDPVTARFMQEDTYTGNTSDPLSLNRYTYCHNEPIRYWDPTGHIITEWDLHNLCVDQLSMIDAATNRWLEADANNDEAEKTAAHAEAESIRNISRTELEVGSSSEDGYTYIKDSSSSTTATLYEEDKKVVKKSKKKYKPKETIVVVPVIEVAPIVETAPVVEIAPVVESAPVVAPIEPENNLEKIEPTKSTDDLVGSDNSSLSTTDHMVGELESGTVGLAQTYDVWYKTEKYNLLTPAQKNAKYKNGKPSNYWAKNNPAKNPLYNPVNVSNLESVINTAGAGAKAAFTKGNIAIAAVGIGLDTFDDVSQLKTLGADDATIEAAVITDVGFGAVGAGISLAAGGAMGAVIGSAVCPIVGTIVGAAVGVGVSYFYDLLTKNVKQSARDNLTNAIRNRNRRMCYYDL